MWLAQRASELRARFYLLGHRSDVPDLLAGADLAVITSDWEARQLFAQEALRAGVPLIATAVGGLPGLVGDAAGADPAGRRRRARRRGARPARRPGACAPTTPPAGPRQAGDLARRGRHRRRRAGRVRVGDDERPGRSGDAPRGCAACWTACGRTRPDRAALTFASRPVLAAVPAGRAGRRREPGRAGRATGDRRAAGHRRLRHRGRRRPGCAGTTSTRSAPPPCGRRRPAGSIGWLSVRSAHRTTCPADGWLTLGAGNYAVWDTERVTGQCHPVAPALEQPDGIGANLPDHAPGRPRQPGQAAVRGGARRARRVGALHGRRSAPVPPSPPPARSAGSTSYAPALPADRQGPARPTVC